MTYIPIVVPPTSSQPPSPRTRELASLLTKVVDEYRNAHPSVSGPEIREALRLTQATAGQSRAPVVLVVGSALALLLGLIVAGLVLAGDGGGVSFRGSMPMVVLAITVFLGILLALVKAANR